MSAAAKAKIAAAARARWKKAKAAELPPDKRKALRLCVSAYVALEMPGMIAFDVQNAKNDHLFPFGAIKEFVRKFAEEHTTGSPYSRSAAVRDFRKELTRLDPLHPIIGRPNRLVGNRTIPAPPGGLPRRQGE
jgi:hypothetical protein